MGKKKKKFWGKGKRETSVKKWEKLWSIDLGKGGGSSRGVLRLSRRLSRRKAV